MSDNGRIRNSTIAPIIGFAGVGLTLAFSWAATVGSGWYFLGAAASLILSPVAITQFSPEEDKRDNGCGSIFLNLLAIALGVGAGNFHEAIASLFQYNYG